MDLCHPVEFHMIDPVDVAVLNPSSLSEDHDMEISLSRNRRHSA